MSKAEFKILQKSWVRADRLSAYGCVNSGSEFNQRLYDEAMLAHHKLIDVVQNGSS